MIGLILLLIDLYVSALTGKSFVVNIDSLSIAAFFEIVIEAVIFITARLYKEQNQ